MTAILPAKHPSNPFGVRFVHSGSLSRGDPLFFGQVVDTTLGKGYDGGDCMPVDTSRNRFQVNERFFDNPSSWTEEQAYWFGWLVTDGSNDKRGRCFGLCIAEQDRSVLELLAKLIGYTGSVGTAVRHDKVTSIAGRPVAVDKQQDRARLFIYNRNLSETIRGLGIKGGKGGDFAPPVINPATYRHYVRAAFEGDGCFSFSRHNKWESNLIGAPQMLADIQAWLLYHDIQSHLGDVWGTPFGNGAKVLRICGNNTGMRLFCLLYPGSQYILPRKLHAFLKLYQYKRKCLLKHCERESFSRFETDILPYASSYSFTD